MTEFVPASAKDISASWLKDALKLAKEPEALEHNQIGKDYGFASHIFRFGWQENLQAKSVVIKFWPIKSEKDITEIKFYKTFQPLGIRTPDYLYGAHSSEHAVLILEDINEAEQGDVLKPLDLLRAKKVARNLAVLHSKWLQHPLLEQNWLTRHLTWRSSANWIQERRKQFLERFPDHLSNQAHLVLL